MNLEDALFFIFIVAPVVLIFSALVYLSMLQAFTAAFFDDWKKLRAKEIRKNKKWIFYCKLVFLFIFRVVLIPLIIAGSMGYLLYKYLM